MDQQMNAILGSRTSGDVDQFGNFLTRVEALRIAKENGQIIRDIGYEPDELYSEHLY